MAYHIEDGVARRFPREVREEQRRHMRELYERYYGTTVTEVDEHGIEYRKKLTESQYRMLQAIEDIKRREQQKRDAEHAAKDSENNA